MKYNKLILTIALFVVSLSMVAQPRLRRPEIYIGGHAGVMASSMIFDPEVKTMEILQSPLSANGGLVFRYAGHKVCAVQVELNYMQRGWSETGENVNYRRQLEYIEIPFLMHLYFGKKYMRGFLNLGPQIGYCIRDTEYGTKNPNDKYQYGSIKHPFDWGAAGGLGLYYRTNNIGLFQLEARFNYSFSSVFDNGTNDHFKFATPIGLSINFAYLWDLKVK